MIKYLFLLYSVILIVLDQIFKIMAYNYLSPIYSSPIIQNIFYFTYVENRGAAFGIFQGNKFFLIFVTSISIIIVIFYIFYKNIKDKFLLFSLNTIIAGGIGNLIDRVFRGYVIDYIDVKIINFAIFNFADICVVLGTIFLISYILLSDYKNNKNSIGVKN